MNALFDNSDPPAQRHSPTSVAAAEVIRPTAWNLRRQVYEYIQGCGLKGATDEQIQMALEMNPSTQRPRRCELCDQELVCDSGRKRLTRSGRQAVVWVARK